MNKGKNQKGIRDADRIVALALMQHLYNEGKISELVYRNIKKDTLRKVSVENQSYICWNENTVTM